MSENEEVTMPEPSAEPFVEPDAEARTEPVVEAVETAEAVETVEAVEAVDVATDGADGTGESTVETVEGESVSADGTTDTAGDATAEGETTDETADAPEKRRKLLRRRQPGRRVKSRTLFVSAVVLGVLGGVASGYAVQSSRADTPLPPLIPTQPQYGPVGIYAGIAPPQLPASQDDMTITDGDLTKLLLPTPAGATINDDWDHAYMGVVDDASTCNSQVACFTSDMSDDVHAIADTGWTKSGYYEEIRIYRFAPQYQPDSWLQEGSGGKSLNPPGDLNAAADEYNDPSNGGNIDFGIATHGDLAVEFWVTSSTKVPDPSVLFSLMTQQMARL
jgi:hypothetical protein